jgi:hypothetical protein
MLPQVLSERYEGHLLVGCLLPDGRAVVDAPAPRLLFPGSFNPLHVGHSTLAETVGRMMGSVVHYEISIANVDKPDLAPGELQARSMAFHQYAPLWVTRAKTFVEKARLFPGVHFVVGYDTAIRLYDSKYYTERNGVARALWELQACGCRFVVGGRVDADGVFRVWKPEGEFQDLFIPIPETVFRVDVASRTLRQAERS